MNILNKKNLREKFKAERSLLTNEGIEKHSKDIFSTLKKLDSYKNAKRIMTFVSMENEVQTHPLIEDAIEEGKSIIVPITVDKTHELLLSELYSLSELAFAEFNIEEPKEEFVRLVKPETIDLVLVPGLALAKDGHRVGYGGGYYDRFLSKLDKSVPKIAIGFDLQVVNRVPVEDFDIPVDIIVTEKRTIDCTKK